MAIAGPLIGAGVNLIGAFLNRGAQQQANQIAYQNLLFQKDQARKQWQLATAGREDAYGNRVDFDPITSEWDIELTPTQQAIIAALQRQQQLSLTEDAERARGLRRRQEAESLQVEPVLDDLMTEYQFGGPDSEESYQDDMTRLMMLGRRRGLDEGQEVLGRQAMRMGMSSSIPALAREVDEMYGDSMEEALLKGKIAGSDEYRKARSSHEGTILQALQHFLRTRDDIGQFQNYPFETPQTTMGMADRGISSAGNAINNASSSIGRSMESLASGVRGSALDLSGVANALGNLDFTKSPGSVTGDIVDPVSLLPTDRQVGDTPFSNLPPLPRPDPRKLNNWYEYGWGA